MGLKNVKRLALLFKNYINYEKINSHLLTTTAIFFTSTLVLIYLNFHKPKNTVVQTQAPTLIPTKVVDPTADWKTYNSVEFGFSINYPEDLLVKNFINDQYNRTVSFVGSGVNLSISLRKSDSNFNLDKYYFMDSPITRTTTLFGQKANVYEMPNGYCDGPGCSQPYIAVVTEHNGDIYSLSFSGDSKLSSLESQILSTFKFIDESFSIVDTNPKFMLSGDNVYKGDLSSISFTFNQDIDQKTLVQKNIGILWGIDDYVPNTIHYDLNSKTATILFNKPIKIGRLTAVINGVRNIKGELVKEKLFNIDIALD